MNIWSTQTPHSSLSPTVTLTKLLDSLQTQLECLLQPSDGLTVTNSHHIVSSLLSIPLTLALSFLPIPSLRLFPSCPSPHSGSSLPVHSLTPALSFLPIPSLRLFPSCPSPHSGSSLPVHSLTPALPFLSIPSLRLFPSCPSPHSGSSLPVHSLTSNSPQSVSSILQQNAIVLRDLLGKI